jgi:ribosome biogenesis protein SSF1/2
MLDPSAAGYTSASDTEQDTDAEVEVAAPVRQKVLSRKEKEKLKAGDEASHARARGEKPRVEKRAVKLVELGPRMKLRLTKIEEDVCGGKILWHEYIKKSKAEEQELEKKWTQRNKEKEERRRIQKENVEKKRKEKAAARGETGEGEGEEDEDEEMDDLLDEYDMDDDVWQDAADAGEEGEEEDEEMDAE